MLGRFIERRRRGTTAGGSDSPTADAKTVAAAGDDDCFGMLHCCVERIGQVVDTDCRTEQPVEQSVDTRPLATGVRSDGVADARRERRSWSGTECNDCATRVAAAQRVQCAAARCWIGDHHGRQRLTECCLNDWLPAFVDFNEVEQGTQDAIDAFEPFGASACTCGIECHL